MLAIIFKLKIILFTLAVILSIPPSHSYQTSEPLRGAVAVGFLNGLHAQHLSYLAEQLSMGIIISEMPLARRLLELKKGNLDIMVGIQLTKQRQSELVYIEPFYESLSLSFFARVGDYASIKTYQDLEGKRIGVSRHSVYFSPFDADDSLHKVQVSSLEQSVRLLLRGRIDMFINYKNSTLLLVEKMAVKDKIFMASYQPADNITHYVVISDKSQLMSKQTALKSIISSGVKQGDFQRIRNQHYLRTNK